MDLLGSMERDAQIGFLIHFDSKRCIFTALPSSPPAKNLLLARCHLCQNPAGKVRYPPGAKLTGFQQRTPLQSLGFVTLILHPALPLPLARL